MKVRQLFDKESSTYTYLIYCLKEKEAALIDPVIDNADKYLKLIEELNLHLKYSIDTHIHADHITAASYLKNETGCNIVMPQAANTIGADIEVINNDKLYVGNDLLMCLSTPGHTHDSFSYFVPSEDIVFTGDSLLIRKCGRTDFQSGSPVALYNSISLLYHFLDNTIVYPGHDYGGNSMTTIGEEKSLNARIKASTPMDEFIKTMSNLELPYPKIMDRVVPMNIRCGQNADPILEKTNEGQVLAVDIDDTVLVTDGPPMYKNPRVIEGALESLNDLVSAGYVIDFYTARHSNMWDITNKQLQDVGFKFRRLVTNKHPAHVYIDDRAMKFADWNSIKEELL